MTQLYLKFNFVRNFSLVLLGLLVILYILQLGQLTDGIYLIKNYNKSIEKTSKENDALEVKFSHANSLENLRALVENLSFAPVEKIDYIKIPADSVVLKSR